VVLRAVSGVRHQSLEPTRNGTEAAAAAGGGANAAAAAAA